MLTELERMLARALAAAVKQQSHMFNWSKYFGSARYELPDWYQPAVEALAAYDQKAQEQKVTY